MIEDKNDGNLVNNPENEAVSGDVEKEIPDISTETEDDNQSYSAGDSRNAIMESFEIRVINELVTVSDIEKFLIDNGIKKTVSIAWSKYNVFDVVKVSNRLFRLDATVYFRDSKELFLNLRNKIEDSVFFPKEKGSYEILSENWLDSIVSGDVVKISLNLDKDDVLIYIAGNPNYQNGYFIFNKFPLKIVLNKKLDVNNLTNFSNLDIKSIETMNVYYKLNIVTEGKEIKTENARVNFSCKVSIKENQSISNPPVTKIIYNISDFSIVFTRLSSSSPMKVIFPKFSKTEETVITINKNEGLYYDLNKDGFYLNSRVDLSVNPDPNGKKKIPKNLLIKMPEGFDKDSFPLAPSWHNDSTCNLNYFYNDNKKLQRYINYFFRTKDGKVLNGVDWNNQIKKMLFNQSGSRDSAIYLESIRNLNYSVEFGSDGRALYDEHSNNIGLAKIKEYRNSEKKVLEETNLIQPFYKIVTAPQTYNFGKKIFLYLNNSPIILVNSRDKKVIINLKGDNRIEIYADDVDTLTKVNKIYLVTEKDGKREIKFENCYINLNLPISNSVGSVNYYGKGKESGGCSGQMGDCNYYTQYTLTEAGKKVRSYVKWFDNQSNFGDNGKYLTSTSSISGIKFNEEREYGGYKHIKYIENLSVVSIELESKDDSKDVVVTLPSYKPDNAYYTQITLNHNGFITSGFNLDRAEFDIKFDSVNLDRDGSKARIIEQDDILNKSFMDEVVQEESLSRSSNDGYDYVNVVYYDPNEDKDGKVRDVLFNQNQRSLTIVFIILGLISSAITFGQRLAEALGAKVSNELKLTLGIIQSVLGIVQMGIGFKGNLIFHNASGAVNFETTTRGISTLSTFFGTIANLPNLANSISNVVDGITGASGNIDINKNVIVRWRDGIMSKTKCSEEVANIIVTHAYVYASYGDITDFRKNVGEDKIEKTTLGYLENMLRYGAEYIYETADRNISIEEAMSLNFIFIKKASITYLQTLVSIYQG